jgi:hypothetical protein
MCQAQVSDLAPRITTDHLIPKKTGMIAITHHLGRGITGHSPNPPAENRTLPGQADMVPGRGKYQSVGLNSPLGSGGQAA